MNAAAKGDRAAPVEHFITNGAREPRKDIAA
jgi:hypothetical protein